MVKFITTFYELITASLLYYKYILRGFFVYNFLPANIALLATVNNICKGENDVPIKELFKVYMDKYNHTKFQSFSVSVPLIIIYSMIYFLQREYNSELNLIILIILLYVFFLHVIILTLYSYVALENNYGFKRTYSIAFYISIKKIWVSISIIALNILLYQLASYNFLLFLFTAPFSYALALHLLLATVNIPKILNTK